MNYFLRKYKSIFHTVSAMSSIRRSGAVLRYNLSRMASELLEISDEGYLEFLFEKTSKEEITDIKQLFDYHFPGSRLSRAREEQVVFVVEKLRADPALAAMVSNFIYQAGLPENNYDAFRNTEYYL